MVHVDEALKQFAESGKPSERRTVLIEPKTATVAAPARSVAAAKKGTGARTSGEGAAFRAVERGLAALSVSVTPLALVGSMVVELTPEQLRQVMSWAEVAAIRENRSHRKTSAVSRN